MSVRPLKDRFIHALPFLAILLLPLLFYPAVDASGWRSSSDVHALMEFASSLLAITAGIMVLLHFLATGRWFFLAISIGFVLIGAEEFVHAIFSFGRIWSETAPTLTLAISTTWLAGNLILSTSLFVALILNKRKIVPAKRGSRAVVYSLIALMFAASLSLLIFRSPIHADFVRLGSITKKLIELSLALLFFVAFLLYSRIYLNQRSRSPLLWGIIVCIIFRVLAHIFVFDSRAFFDAHWDIAHLLVFLSYLFPIYGVWGETVRLQRSSQAQVLALEREMTERKQAEESIKVSEEKYRMIFDRAPIGIALSTIDGKIIDVNKAQAEMLGVTVEELQGRSVNEYYVDPGKRREMVELFKKAGKVRDFEMELKRMDGSIIVELMNLDQIETGGGARLFATGRDVTKLKRAEGQLQQSEMQYRSLAENSPDLIARFDRQCRHLFVNSAAAKAGPFAPEAYIGKTILATGVPEQEARKWEEHIGTAFETGQIVEVEDFFKTPNGLRTFSTKFVPEFAPDGSILSVQSVARDITERKRAEEALRESEDKYRTLFDNAGEAIFVAQGGKLVFSNPMTARLLDYPGEVIRTTPFTEFIHSEDRNLVVERHVMRLRGEELPEVYSFRILRGDGLALWVDIRAVLINWEGQAATLNFVSDITERKRAEEALLESERKFRETVINLDEGYYSATVDGVLLEHNRAFSRILGFDGSVDLKGKLLPDFWQDPDARNAYLKELMAQGFISNHQVDAKTKTGEKITVLANAHLSKDQDDRPLRIEGIIQDITERKRAEEALQASLREKEILLREIHHRVKNNMQVISSLFNLEAGTITAENARRMLKEGQMRIRSMALVHEKLYQSRDLSKIDFADYLRSLSAHLFHFYRIEAGRIRLEMHLEPIPLNVNSAVPCGLLVNELVSNSLKHAFPADRKGTVTIGLRKMEEGIVELRVADDGAGFPEALDFRRTDGLGLQIVSLLVDQLDGTIELDRKKGTAFTIVFRELAHKATV
jgi:PAS domain S-box-containing protein